ncbi:hypothetical protein OF83DRAFT_559466 [Amylostereum chailletii]|nr:hypothetical protein OF83DRAFT_559466 [Amylostereum chailletii]
MSAHRVGAFEPSVKMAEEPFVSRLAKRGPSNDTVVVAVSCVVIGAAVLLVFGGVFLYFRYRRRQQSVDRTLEGQASLKESIPPEMMSLPVLPNVVLRPDSPRPSAPSEESTAHSIRTRNSQEWASSSFLFRPVTPPSLPRQRSLPQRSPRPPIPPLPQYTAYLTTSPHTTPASSTLDLAMSPLPTPHLRTPSFSRPISPAPSYDPFPSTTDPRSPTIDPRSPTPARHRSVGSGRSANGLPASPRATRRALSTTGSVASQTVTPRRSAESYARPDASSAAWWNEKQQHEPMPERPRTAIVTATPPRTTAT